MVVRMRHNRSQTRQRRSHHKICPATLTKCLKCGAAVLPHRVCGRCGTYRGRTVIDVFSRLDKKEKKKKKE